MPLSEKQETLCETSSTDYSDLRALFVNCTLKRSPEVSHTQGLADIAVEILRRNGVAVEVVRAVDHEIPVGVYPDMTEHGWERDDWPAISERVMAADILVLCTPIWLGEKSSVCTKVVERLYLHALSRLPTEEETQRLLDLVRNRPPPEARVAYVDILWALMNSSEFAFNH